MTGCVERCSFECCVVLWVWVWVWMWMCVCVCACFLDGFLRLFCPLGKSRSLDLFGSISLSLSLALSIRCLTIRYELIIRGQRHPRGSRQRSNLSGSGELHLDVEDRWEHWAGPARGGRVLTRSRYLSSHLPSSQGHWEEHE